MARVLGPLLRLPRRTWSMIRRRPLTALAVTLAAVLLVGAGTGLGLWLYARHQWQAAQAAVREARLEDARDRLDFCLRVWPRDPEVHLLAARVARQRGDLDAAESHLNRCLQLQGGASEALQLEFLLVRAQSGELDEVAEPLLATVEKGHPDGPVILETLARAYMNRLRYKMAWSCLSRWIDLRPNEARAYQWRGWVLEQLNNPKAATADYHRALELDPDLVPVRLRVAEMLLEDKQAPEALPHLERLYRQVPDDPRVRARLGTCRLLQGRLAEARQLMESALPHLKRDPALLVALANLDLQEGHGAEAERRLRAVLKTDPSDTEALYVLASALQLQGRTEEAAAVRAEYERKKKIVERINDFLKDVADSPTARADDYAEAGRLLLEIGRDNQGTYWLGRALERDPGNQKAHRAFVTYYVRKGDAERAAAHRRQLRDPDPVPAGPPTRGPSP